MHSERMGEYVTRITTLYKDIYTTVSKEVIAAVRAQLTTQKADS